MGLFIHIGEELRRLEQKHEKLRQQFGFVGAEDGIRSADDLVIVVELVQADGADVDPVGVIAELVGFNPVVCLPDLHTGLSLIQEHALGIGDPQNPKADVRKIGGLDPVGIQLQIITQSHSGILGAALKDLSQDDKLLVLLHLLDRRPQQILTGNIKLQAVPHIEQGKNRRDLSRR
ncbi:MAG: hypothetical protein L6271_06070, partial [Desulfobacteraceae bacterium]|nr:hypothetical protein [Desulfobacteraceae bacterium]